MKYFDYFGRQWWVWLIGGLTVGLLLIHLWGIASLPRGLYVDESSIGYNAALIAQTGYDEHHQFLPVFFEAFGEYKNSLYIYTAAGLFKLLGVSVFALRLTSWVYFSLFLLGLIAFVRQIFPQKKVILLYAILAGGSLPWLFSLSRISFEVISQPTVMIWALYAMYRTYQTTETKPSWKWAGLTGFLLGLSLYSYSTARLLTFGSLGILGLVYFKRQYWQRHLYLGIGFILAALPFGFFWLTHPDSLTARFGLLSYLYNPSLSFSQKLGQFLIDYLSYFNPLFLFISGDGNLRHHAGGAGELYLVVGLLALVGIAWQLRRKPTGRRQFGLVLLLNLLGAPLAAALTEPSHSLRSVLVGVYLLLLSVYGLYLLTRVSSRYWRNWLVGGALVLVTLEASYYLTHYFNQYPDQTVWAFESYDFPSVLVSAEAQQPEQVIISNHSNQAYAHLEFYRRAISTPLTIPIKVGDPIARLNTCVIYFSSDETIIDSSLYQVTFSSDTNYTKLRCFGQLKSE